MTLALALAAAAGATPPARLSLYLQLRGSPRRSIRWRMGGLALRGGGWWRELAGGPWEVDSARLGEGQLLLGCFVLRPGRYDALRLRALKASLRREGQRRMLALDRPRVALPLPRPLELRGGDSVCLFLEWDVDASLREGFLFRPCLRVRLQRPPLRGELLYVTCDDIGTLYVVGANANRVVAALGVGPCPRGLLLDPEGNRLYVVDSRDRAVRVVELSTNRVVDSLALPAMLEAANRRITVIGGPGHEAEVFGHNFVPERPTLESQGWRLEISPRTAAPRPGRWKAAREPPPRAPSPSTSASARRPKWTVWRSPGPPGRPWRSSSKTSRRTAA